MMASSSSSSSPAPNLLYHVFLSFRGENVRKGFLSHVLKEFKSKGINVFIDNEIKRGESVGRELVKAIRHSRVAVVLLSPNYASSSWCLGELVEIMKCRKEVGRTVLTIFYQVDPSDVRKQTGDFGKAFDETCVGKTEEVKQVWRQALEDVAGIAGYHSSNWGSEADLINKVASDVMAGLGFRLPKDFDDFLGIEARITEIKSKFILQSEQVKVIGILGPPGIGKTTTARVLYNQLSPDFPFSTFLENIRGSYEKSRGNDYRLKLRLQKNLLSQIFNKGDIEVHHLRGAPKMLSGKKVLVVFDEVDNWWQLEEMANQPGWVGPRSIIIITTEDRKLLKALGLGSDHIYRMKCPTRDESLQIFCQHAFGQKSPDHGFERLAREITWLAGYIPLGLRVMGSCLRGMSRDKWNEALRWLRSTCDREIESILRFSYDALGENERTLFLHLACFFAGFSIEQVKRYFANRSLEVNHGLEVVAQKSLISIVKGCVEMHSLLEQMGREIVKKQYLEEPGKRQFLMDAKDISDALDQDTVTGNVLGIEISSCKYAVLPGEEVPAHFTHRASSSSLTITSTPRPLPSSFRFQACILVSEVYDHLVFSKRMSYSVRAKQNGLTVGSRSNMILIPGLYRPDLFVHGEYLYIFEDDFTLNQDCPEAEETTFSDFTFVFRVHDENCKVKGCGVQLFEFNLCILERKETYNQDCMGINIESTNERAGGEDGDEDEDYDADDSGNGGEEDDDDDDDEDHVDDDEGGDDDNNKVVENDDVMPHSSDSLSNQSSPFSRGTPSSGGPIRHMPPHPSAIPQYSSNPYASLPPRTSTVQTFGYNQGGAGTTEQQQSGPSIDPQSGTGMTSYPPPISMQSGYSRPFYGSPMHQGGDKQQQNMLPVPQSLNPHSILQQMQLSRPQRPMQPPQHVRPSMQISQPTDQGVSLQNQYQIPLHPMQMMQQTQVQPYYHPPQQQEISYRFPFHPMQMRQQTQVQPYYLPPQQQEISYQIPLHPMQMMPQTQVQPYYHPPQQQDISHVQQQQPQQQAVQGQQGAGITSRRRTHSGFIR
ncbi:disease resistance-like protein DSC2 [Raphanus sativus]|uniref:ADP-ribosyl cyclase/cyclic ADP-ribose hydrolase n=1 Tax=Raphanus sativus TaxID=3726 RepID=A0A6J0NU58_RAPSA|nr:disease resistance-like protein DSC2 [Raphanus sativus]